MDRTIQIDVVHDGQPDNSFMANLVRFCARLPVSAICADLPARSIQAFNPASMKNAGNIIFSYNHSPVLAHNFLQDIHKTDQIFQPLLFCRKNYFKQHKSWGYPIFHFTDNQPEIHEITPVNGKVRVVIPNPEDVAAVYVLKGSGGGMRAQNIIARLDRQTGTLPFKVEDNHVISLIVFRKLFLYFDQGLRYLINIHDDFLLSRHGKQIAENGHFNLFQEARLDTDMFFAHDGFISYTPEITRNYHHISARRFLADQAIHIYQHRNKKDSSTPVQTLLYNRYINGNLLAKLNYIHSKITFISSITSSYMLRNLATVHTVFHIDEDRFQFEPLYKRRVICNLQRIKSYLFGNGVSVPVLQVGPLFDMTRSFAEKKTLIDQLMLYGAGGFNFIISVNEDNSAFFNQFIFNDKERGELYNIWLTYVTQMTALWNTGKIHGGALILFPSWDTDHEPFFNDMKQVIGAGIPFQLIDQEEIKTQDVHIGPSGEIYSPFGIFDYLLIPATQILLRAANDLVRKIIDHGGRVVALTHLPSGTGEKQHQNEFDSFIAEYWLTNPGKPAISFKEHNSGGRTYLIREPDNLTALLEVMPRICPLRFYGKQLTAFCKQTDAGFLIFLYNGGKLIDAGIPFSGKSSFYFEKYNPLTKHFEALAINGAKQSGYRIDQAIPEHSSLLIRAVPVETAIKTQKKCKERTVGISSNDWYVEEGSKTETARLGDRSIIEPYAWQPLTYSKLFVLPADIEEGSRVYIDFGTVKSWGRLKINDKDLGIQIFQPFRWEITHLLRPGKNGITLRVGHQLSNYFALDDESNGHILPVKPYGLIGPVKLIITKD